MIKKITLILTGIIFLAGTLLHAKTVTKYGYKIYCPEKDTELPNVYVITTGGTIAEEVKSKDKGAKPELSGNALMSKVHGINKIADTYLINFCNIDSSHMSPEIWIRLSRLTTQVLKEKSTAGAVIIHGTDTMALGSFYLELTVDSTKPVVFTGSMRNASELSYDGPINIYNAVLQAASEKAQNWGVTVVLNSYINAALYAAKTQSVNPHTFNSGDKGYLGYIVMGKVIKYNEAPPKLKFELPDPKDIPNVPYFAIYPGDKAKYIRQSVDDGVDGLVISGFGAGNVNIKAAEAINYALQKDIPVVVSTEVPHGGVFPIYGTVGGGAYLKNKGVILSGQLDGQKARLLLMLALSQYGNDKAKINECFNVLGLKN
ncbi:MAG: asparaginase [Victivallales bacterium]|nr:asparaginase [Victivallales bacterium]MCF7888575.1 asparaginase [Victivallales bacterium]